MIPADYFDGRTSRRHPVSVALRDGALHVTGEGVACSVPAAAVRARPPVGRTPPRLELPGGALLVGTELAALADALPRRPAGTADRLESHLGVVLLALLALPLLGAFAYRQAIPWAAALLALRFPAALEHELGSQSLHVLDRRIFGESGLRRARRKRLAARFEALRRHAALPDATLSFRAGGSVGANAFALPGGIVVVTDELAADLTDDQITAVLAHELGHVEARHALRALFQNSAVAVAATVVFGDAGAVTFLAASVPTILAQAAYSRGHERDADAAALALLRRAGHPPRLLGDALAALAGLRTREEADGSDEGWEAGPLRYLSTHPVTAARVRAAREAGGP